MKIKLKFPNLMGVINRIRPYKIQKDPLKIEHEIIHVHSNQKGKFIKASVTVSNSGYWASSLSYERIEFDTPAEIRRSAEWLVKVAEEFNKIALEMEAPVE
jgi:hypothetical protein